MPGPLMHATRLVALLLCVALPCPASAARGLDSADPVPVRQQVQEHGIGKVVRMTQKDGREVRGRVVSVGDDSCVLQIKNQATPVTVPYNEVTRVRGPGLGRGAKIGIVVGVVLVALGIIGTRV